MHSFREVFCAIGPEIQACKSGALAFNQRERFSRLRLLTWPQTYSRPWGQNALKRLALFHTPN